MRLFFDIFRQTLATLWAHKLRSFLTMFGIAWGVGSLLLLVGLGEGFRKGNRKQLESIGQNIMFVFGGRIPAAEGRATAMRPFQLAPATSVRGSGISAGSPIAGTGGGGGASLDDEEQAAATRNRASAHVPTENVHDLGVVNLSPSPIAGTTVRLPGGLRVKRPCWWRPGGRRSETSRSRR